MTRRLLLVVLIPVAGLLLLLALLRPDGQCTVYRPSR
jgi:hypothetical protein